MEQESLPDAISPGEDDQTFKVAKDMHGNYVYYVVESGKGAEPNEKDPNPTAVPEGKQTQSTVVTSESLISLSPEKQVSSGSGSVKVVNVDSSNILYRLNPETMESLNQLFDSFGASTKSDEIAASSQTVESSSVDTLPSEKNEPNKHQEVDINIGLPNTHQQVDVNIDLQSTLVKDSTTLITSEPNVTIPVQLVEEIPVMTSQVTSDGLAPFKPNNSYMSTSSVSFESPAVPVLLGEVKKTVSAFVLDFSAYPEVCSCSAADVGRPIPIEQIWVRSNQMYYLEHAIVLIICKEEFVGFERGGKYYVSVSEVMLRLLPEFQNDIENYLMKFSCDIEDLSLEELAYLQQRNCVNLNCGSMISLASLRTMCRNLLGQRSPAPSNLYDAANGVYYSKVLGNHIRCSKCGGVIRLLDCADMYQEFDRPQYRHLNSNPPMISQDQVNRTSYKQNHNVVKGTRSRRRQNKFLKSIQVGHVTVGSLRFNAFSLNDNTYISLQELVENRVTSLPLLQRRLLSLQYRPRPAPSVVEVYFKTEGINVDRTLWIDLVTVRCMCCMGPIYQTGFNEDVHTLLSRGHFSCELNRAFKGYDDCILDGVVYTLNPKNNKISDKRSYPEKNQSLPTSAVSSEMDKAAPRRGRAQYNAHKRSQGRRNGVTSRGNISNVAQNINNQIREKEVISTNSSQPLLNNKCLKNNDGVFCFTDKESVLKFFQSVTFSGTATVSKVVKSVAGNKLSTSSVYSTKSIESTQLGQNCASSNSNMSVSGNLGIPVVTNSQVSGDLGFPVATSGQVTVNRTSAHCSQSSSISPFPLESSEIFETDLTGITNNNEIADFLIDSASGSPRKINIQSDCPTTTNSIAGDQMAFDSPTTSSLLENTQMSEILHESQIAVSSISCGNAKESLLEKICRETIGECVFDDESCVRLDTELSKEATQVKDKDVTEADNGNTLENKNEGKDSSSQEGSIPVQSRVKFPKQLVVTLDMSAYDNPEMGNKSVSPKIKEKSVSETTEDEQEILLEQVNSSPTKCQRTVTLYASPVKETIGNSSVTKIKVLHSPSKTCIVQHKDEGGEQEVCMDGKSGKRNMETKMNYTRETIQSENIDLESRIQNLITTIRHSDAESYKSKIKPDVNCSISTSKRNSKSTVKEMMESKAVGVTSLQSPNLPLEIPSDFSGKSASNDKKECVQDEDKTKRETVCVEKCHLDSGIGDIQDMIAKLHTFKQNLSQFTSVAKFVPSPRTVKSQIKFGGGAELAFPGLFGDGSLERKKKFTAVLSRLVCRAYLQKEEIDESAKETQSSHNDNESLVASPKKAKKRKWRSSKDVVMGSEPSKIPRK